MREIPSPVGTLRIIASARGLRAILWADENVDAYPGLSTSHTSDQDQSSDLLDEVERQLAEYFSGRRQRFEIPLDPVGTEFQIAAWKVLSTIAYAHTISYADQARALGDERKARAVGGANGRNPIPIVVPCHRVIGSNGSLTGFAVGTDIKKFLLDLERRYANE